MRSAAWIAVVLVLWAGSARAACPEGDPLAVLDYRAGTGRICVESPAGAEAVEVRLHYSLAAGAVTQRLVPEGGGAFPDGFTIDFAIPAEAKGEGTIRAVSIEAGGAESTLAVFDAQLPPPPEPEPACTGAMRDVEMFVRPDGAFFVWGWCR